MKFALILVVASMACVFQTEGLPQAGIHSLVKRADPFGLASPILRTACRDYAWFDCPTWDNPWGLNRDKGEKSAGKDNDAAAKEGAEAAPPAEADPPAA